MPRKAREKSKSGIYHIMLRGNNRQTIFEDDEDRKIFLSHLEKCLNETGAIIYAWCLMNNHIHLMIQLVEQDISLIMRKLGAKYVYWYNRKYDRVGNLFQDRFKSEQIEDEKYFLTVLRYIHQNPVKAGLCSNISDYRYSSYPEYIKPQRRQLTDTSLALGMMKIADLEKYHQERYDDKCLDIRNIKRINDNDAKEIILMLSGCNLVTQLKSMERETRNEIVCQLKEQGLTIRQIERLTGINRGIIQRA